MPDLVELLRDNVQLNWLTDRVEVRPVAVGEAPGRAPFSFDSRLQMLGGLDSRTQRALEVDVVSLDSDLEPIPRIDLLKVDVEGGEASVLAGASELLNSGRVDRVSCEVRRDAHGRVGGPCEWPRLMAMFDSMKSDGWTFGLIDANGRELDRSLDEILATEPHPNVVARRPDLQEQQTCGFSK